ncbi:MAG: DUF86 domain-containing protein [archaeon]|nr:DUF86 domain-containing protein [archaeon]
MNKELMDSKMESLAELLQKLKMVLEEHEKNKRLQEFLLYAAEKKAEEIVELAISINQELLKEMGKIALSYYESFTALKVFGCISEKELKELASTAGFRNRLAHEYLEIDQKVALRSMKNILVIYPVYMKKIKKMIDGRKII